MSNWISATNLSRTPEHLRDSRSTPELKELARKVLAAMLEDPECPFREEAD